MGQLCSNCSHKSTSVNSLNLSSFASSLRDPRLADISTHLKILDAKLNSNITSIEDFLHLLIESNKEILATHKDILAMITNVDTALQEAKTNLMQVTQRRSIVKGMIEKADSQIESFGNSSRQVSSKHQSTTEVDSSALNDNNSSAPS